MATDNNNTTNLRPNDMNAFFDENANSGFKFKDLVFLILHNQLLIHPHQNLG